MSIEQYEYRIDIKTNGGQAGSSGVITDPKRAGKAYRDYQDTAARDGGGEVELKRRSTLPQPWETVESTKV